MSGILDYLKEKNEKEITMTLNTLSPVLIRFSTSYGVNHQVQMIYAIQSYCVNTGMLNSNYFFPLVGKL